MKKILMFFMVFGVCLRISAFAQIVLDTYRQKLDITPGESISGTIVVKNSSNENISVKGYIEDFEYLSPFDGRKKFMPAGSTLYSLAEWITLTPPVFTLAPSREQKVSYIINVPKEAKGGYYGVLFFEKLNTRASEGVGIGVVLKMGCTLLLETKGNIKDVKIENIGLDTDTINGEFLNSSNLILVSKPNFYIMNEKGVVLDKGEIREFTLPPNEKVPFIIKLSQKIPQGNHTIFINFDSEGSNVLAKEIDFTKDASGGIKIGKVKD